VCLGAALAGLQPSARAILFHSTGNPGYNLGPPGGALTNSGWQYIGLWGAYVGTVVGPRHFLTARHVGGQVGDPFVFQGRTYTALAFADDPDTDLRLVRVCGTLPGPVAPPYTNFNETSKSLVVMGRGTQRGSEVRVGGVLKGWTWGLADTGLRWGENRVTGLVPSTTTNFLMVNFDATGGTNEAHLSTGDSSGPVFIKEGTVWKLAGINYAVDGPFNTTNSGDGFYAALFDTGGLYDYSDSAQAWVFIPDQAGNLPSAFYATRVSTRVPWMQSVLAQAVPPDPAPVLESAATLGGTFTVESAAVVNATTRTIVVPSGGGGRRFYRLNGCGAYRILSVTVSGPDVVLTYE
jgi:hypothetical protein